MPVQEDSSRGLSLRRQFDCSRLEEQLFEAVYDTLLCVLTPVASDAAGKDVAIGECEDEQSDVTAAAA